MHDPEGLVRLLQVSLAAANDKPAQFDRRGRNATTGNLGVPSFPGNR